MNAKIKTVSTTIALSLFVLSACATRMRLKTNVQADDLEDRGILLGEAYDEKLTAEILAQREESYSGQNVDQIRL
jgi:hypothetical protein